MPELFAKSNLMGTFKGFSERGFEFAAEIVTPYNSNMQDRPQLGQFILIELGTPEEASLARITKFVPSGLLASAEGEDYVNTMQERERPVPEDLKKQKLKYKVHVKLLGAVKNVKLENEQGSLTDKVVFVPSQRRLPHLGAKVALPSEAVLRELCQLSDGETDLGNYVLGEFVYSNSTAPDNVMRHIAPELKVTFNINNLVSRRTVVFARAGYGKSNLIKYLMGELYRNGVPKTETDRKVGVLIFDADGEYFWPDFKGRPGLCDVEQLKHDIVVFTSRTTTNRYYDSWKAGNVRLDVRTLPARDVIGIAVSSDRQNQQNVLKLKALNSTNWPQLVDLIYTQGLGADDKQVARLLGYPEDSGSMAEIAAAKSNMNNVVHLLHDPDSQLISGTIDALSKGHCVVVDISMLSSTAGNNIAGLLLRKIFNHNQQNFTGESPIPVIAVIEEAQSVLGRNLEESSPFVEWVKEGRKYDLGAILVTQQPGSMAPELLSQADNWFCFHLLAEGDAATLGKYNSHYSHDVLAHLIGEPIQGNCYMWSAPKQPFVLPVRIRSFEALYRSAVVKDAEAEPFEESPAIELRKVLEAKDTAITSAAISRLKTGYLAGTLGQVDFGKTIGVFHGWVWKIVDDLKKTPDFESERRDSNELKQLVLKKGFGVDRLSIQQSKHPMRDEQVNYLCVPKESWEKMMSDESTV